MFDVAIIGGGPAGLSAALVLGRACRRVVVIDEGKRRNAAAVTMNGYLTRDGIAPAEFLRHARVELERYDVEFRPARATAARRLSDSTFESTLDSGQVVRSRRLLLATGVRDNLPTVPGFAEIYGISAHHCPFCDGWEHRGERLAAYGKGSAAVGLALMLRTWSERVVACTAGEGISGRDRGRAQRNGIVVRTEDVERLEGESGRLRRVHFSNGEPEAASALFFNTGQVQRSGLPAALGCSFKEDGGVETNDRQCTGVPGLYLAGDAHKEVQFVIVAAAEGAVAAIAIDRELQDEDRGEARGP